MDFEWVLGGFWEAKIHDFRIFFIVFSKSFLKHAREQQKIDPRAQQDGSCAFLLLDSGSPQAPGERKREGSENLAETLGLLLELGPF